MGGGGGSALGEMKVDGQLVKPQKPKPKALTKRGPNPTNLLNPTTNNLVQSAGQPNG